MAQQFQSPENYAAGQQLTAARLNNMVNNAVPLPGLIGDRTALTASTLASDDKFLILDTSASALRTANASDILSSGLPITTPGISYSGQDIQVNVSDSSSITTASFLSSDGITVTVTATAHGFSPGGTNLIEVTGAPSTYNGIFVFNYVDANTFTYTTFFTGTPVTSPTVITVKRKGAQRNASSIVTNSYLSVTQQSIFGGTIYSKGSLNILGSLTCPTSATFSGTTNFTGSIQKSGSNLYSLYSIDRVLIAGVLWNSTTDGRYTYSSTWYQTTGKTFYSESFTVPQNEIWEINYDASLHHNSDDGFELVWLKNNAIDDGAIISNQVGSSNPIARAGYIPINHLVILTGGTGTGGTTYTIACKFGVFGGSGADYTGFGTYTLPGRYIIRKYKI